MMTRRGAKGRVPCSSSFRGLVDLGLCRFPEAQALLHLHCSNELLEDSVWLPS